MWPWVYPQSGTLSFYCDNLQTFWPATSPSHSPARMITTLWLQMQLRLVFIVSVGNIVYRTLKMGNDIRFNAILKRFLLWRLYFILHNMWVHFMDIKLKSYTSVNLNIFIVTRNGSIYIFWILNSSRKFCFYLVITNNNCIEFGEWFLKESFV